MARPKNARLDVPSLLGIVQLRGRFTFTKLGMRLPVERKRHLRMHGCLQLHSLFAAQHRGEWEIESYADNSKTLQTDHTRLRFRLMHRTSKTSSKK